MDAPEDLRYTTEHEWIRPLGESRYRLGITAYAQDQLGDIVFVGLPQVGDELEEGSLVAEVESTKSVGEVYAPFTGRVVAINETVRDRPELVNQEPYGEGWLVEMEGTVELGAFLDAAAYQALVG